MMKRAVFVSVLLLLPAMASGQALTRLASSPQVVGTMTTEADVITFPIDVGIGYGSIGVEARGTWTGTVEIQCLASRAGGTYVAIQLLPRASSTPVTSFTVNGQWSGSITGCQAVRATATAAMTGTVTITMIGSFAGGGGGSGGPTTVTANQGTSPWIVAGGGTAGSPGAAVLTVQGVGSGTAVIVAPSSGAFASDGTFGLTLPATGPAIGLRAETTTPTAVTDGQQVASMADVSGRQFVVNGATDNPLVSLTGCALVSAASTNATNCKASAGNFYGFRAINTTATLYYLRMYNLASAPTCSSATGWVESIPIPASTSGAGIVSFNIHSENYSTGIGYCFTGGSSSTDNTNAATGVFGRLFYK